MKVKITEKTFIKGEPVKRGDIVEVSEKDALTLIQIKKAEKLGVKNDAPTDPDGLGELTQKELVELAKDMGIANFDKMKKDQLIKSINRAEAEKKK